MRAHDPEVRPRRNVRKCREWSTTGSRQPNARPARCRRAGADETDRRTYACYAAGQLVTAYSFGSRHSPELRRELKKCDTGPLLHRILGQLRRTHPALRARSDFFYFNRRDHLERGVISYRREATARDAPDEKLVVVLNFSDGQADVSVPFPNAGRGGPDRRPVVADGSRGWPLRADHHPFQLWSDVRRRLRRHRLVGLMLPKRGHRRSRRLAHGSLAREQARISSVQSPVRPEHTRTTRSSIDLVKAVQRPVPMDGELRDSWWRCLRRRPPLPAPSAPRTARPPSAAPEGRLSRRAARTHRRSTLRREDLGATLSLPGRRV